MSRSRPELRLGRIIWAHLPDSHGFIKRRPAIILTGTSEIVPSQPFTVLAISTSYPDPPPEECIELPWHRDKRRVMTRLDRRSAAVLTWFRPLQEREIEELAGDVPPRLMFQIIKAHREMRDQKR